MSPHKLITSLGKSLKKNHIIHKEAEKDSARQREHALIMPWVRKRKKESNGVTRYALALSQKCSKFLRVSFCAFCPLTFEFVENCRHSCAACMCRCSSTCKVNFIQGAFGLSLDCFDQVGMFRCSSSRQSRFLFSMIQTGCRSCLTYMKNVSVCNDQWVLGRPADHPYVAKTLSLRFSRTL